MIIKQKAIIINRMNNKSGTRKSYWTESNQIFFSPKLSLEGKNMLPQIGDIYLPHHQPARQEENFLTVFKKPIISVYQRITQNCNNTHNMNYFRKNIDRKEKKPVCVVGHPKEFEKRTQTTNQKRRNLTADYEVPKSSNSNEGEIMLLRNYRQTINQVAMNNKKTRKSQKRVEKPVQNGDYYYYIGSGNNSELIQRVMRRRIHWTPTTSTIFHFRWEQVRPKFHNNQNIQKQLLNHLPNHEAISDKGSLLKNLKVFCEKHEEELFKIIPVCFEFNFGDLDLCEVEIKRFIEFYWENNDRNGRYGLDLEDRQIYKEKQKDFNGEKEAMETYMDKDMEEFVDKKMDKNVQGKKDKEEDEVIQMGKSSFWNKSKEDTQSSKKQNKAKSSPSKNSKMQKKDWNGMGENGRKKEEIKQLHRSLLGKIKSFYLFQDMSNLKKESPFLAPIQSQVYGNTSLWLLKPADLNRGRGIRLFRTIDELGDLLRTEFSHHQKSSYIIQKYIQKPLLIGGRKFDIRAFVMVTQNRELFIFREGYIKTSSTAYDLLSNNYFSHLTNNAIQKNSKKYGEFEEGNILKLQYLFEKELVEKKFFFEQMKRLVRVSMRSVFQGSKIFTRQETESKNGSLMSNFSSFHTNSKNLNNTKYFQIFGYDFMLDTEGHLWIIQVNTNPSIELASQWLKQIIPRMLDDAFKITLDRIFPKGRELSIKEDEVYFEVEGYKNDVNMWEYMELKSELEMDSL